MVRGRRVYAMCLLATISSMIWGDEICMAVVLAVHVVIWASVVHASTEDINSLKEKS